MTRLIRAFARAATRRARPALYVLRLILLSAVITMWAAPVLAQCDPVPGCARQFKWHNSYRQLYGEITQECDWHGPWDYLGVKTNYYPYPFQHDYEFRGWHWAGARLEWNGCTASSGSWPPPNCAYYNGEPQCVTQRDDPEFVFHTWYIGITPGWECDDIYAGGVDFTGVTMEVWGNDVTNPDDWYSTLTYPTLHISVSCSDEWNCQGSSSATSPTSSYPDEVTAQLRVSLETWVDWAVPEWCE